MMFLNVTRAIKVCVFAATPLACFVEAAEFDADLGLTLSGQQNHVIGEENEAELHPYLNLKYGMFVASPEGVGMTTNVGESNQLSALFLMRKSVIDHDDNKQLAYLGKRKDATELALHWTHFAPYVDITGTVSMDVSDAHDGYEAKLMLSKRIETALGSLIPAAAIQYQSDDLVDYYYGVRTSEASSSFSAYKGKASTNANVSMTHVYPMTDQWHVATTVAYDYLGDGISDSTIVKESGYWSGSMTVFYAF